MNNQGKITDEQAKSIRIMMGLEGSGWTEDMARMVLEKVGEMVKEMYDTKIELEQLRARVQELEDDKRNSLHPAQDI